MTDRTAGPKFKTGDQIAGKYSVDRELGRGGMGAVYAATHIQMQAPRAIKVMIANPTTTSPDAVERFIREARAAGQLKSEHAIRIHDIDSLPGIGLYLVMEYVEGVPLDKLLRDRGPLAVADAARCIAQACDAMAEAHRLGIVHRDLKPSNLILTKNANGQNSLKVLDFGVAKLKGPMGSAFESPLTRTVAYLGTPLYMAPEQWGTSRDVDPRTDIWSLGVILYELTTGRVPFRASTLGELLAAVQRDPPAPPSRIRPEIPPRLEQIILKCLDKGRENRFQSADELAQELLPFVTGASRSGIAGATADLPIPSVDTNSAPRQRSEVFPEPHAYTQTFAPTDASPRIFPAMAPAGPPSSPRNAEPATPPRQPRSKRPWAIASAGMIASAAIALFVVVGRKENEEAQSAPDAPVIAPAPSSPPAESLEPPAPSRSSRGSTLPPAGTAAAPSAAATALPATATAPPATAKANPGNAPAPEPPAKPTSNASAKPLPAAPPSTATNLFIPPAKQGSF